jgi:hypothetical protein
MRKLLIILCLVALLLAITTAWQVVANQVANTELQDDMKDMASELGVRIGLSPSKTDDELRDAVINKAIKYDIKLTRRQVKVRHLGSGPMRTLYLQADYTVPVNLPGYSFEMHFSPATDKKLMYWRSN